MPKKVAIVGTGVIGLGVALRLLRRGYDVVLRSDQDHFFPTSPVAAAFWFPYACHLSVEQESKLAGPTFEFLSRCVEQPMTGVTLRKGRCYFDETVEENEIVAPWWTALSPHFRSLKAIEIPTHLRSDASIGPIEGGWEFKVPVVHIPTFLEWMRSQILALGGQFVVGKVASLDVLSAEFDAIVNCTGGWATHLTEDPFLVAYQGTVLEVPGEPLGDELVFLEKGKSSELPTYIVPQTTRTILGGTLRSVTRPGERWTPGSTGFESQWTPPDLDGSDILERCGRLAGKVGRQSLPTSNRHLKSKAGLRPVRIDHAPRIEIETAAGRPTIHNYGHGGSGVTLFWGSAITACELVESSIA